MKLSTQDYTDEIIFNVDPHEVYEALMDSTKHEAFTGADADIDRNVGGAFSAWDGYISGENIELVQNEKIVQKWRTTEWPEGHFSTVTFELEETDNGGTKLVFVHEGIPDEFYDEIVAGWADHYWEPMKEYFTSN